MNKKIPLPSIERLCAMYHIVEQLEENGFQKVSSIELGKQLGVNANSIRKDISYLGEIGNCRAGYKLRKLREILTQNLQINRKRTTCIVGLGRLGTAILEYDRLTKSGLGIVAGFDSNINKIETIQTPIPLYPASEIASVVKKEKIELAVLAVPALAAAESAKRLIGGGILGIVNFSPAFLKPVPGVYVRNIDLVKELRILSIVSMLSSENIL
jgi:redox-sensing transcriptional repressor